MIFEAVVTPRGNALCVEVPAEVLEAFGAGSRPEVAITINGHTWRSRVAAMSGTTLIGISAANRDASRIAAGDLVEVDLRHDTEPRIVELPADLAEALAAAPGTREAFERLGYGLRRKHVRDIEASKSPETRTRRIARLVEALG
ncbi:YdeI/OmpD-associated family protein [Nonomuraea sediminis]|uniref:YdeI/OmpD-associated family protein n=1 Tax=Nonomuraea sediminis TaxID=2835864 RepID=UPI001BDC9D54|nr:YdeI/OmpD-associated family protein [Nonomuraea sediminis]